MDYRVKNKGIWQCWDVSLATIFIYWTYLTPTTREMVLNALILSTTWILWVTQDYYNMIFCPLHVAHESPVGKLFHFFYTTPTSTHKHRLNSRHPFHRIHRRSNQTLSLQYNHRWPPHYDMHYYLIVPYNRYEILNAAKTLTNYSIQPFLYEEKEREDEKIKLPLKIRLRSYF